MTISTTAYLTLYNEIKNQTVYLQMAELGFVGLMGLGGYGLQMVTNLVLIIRVLLLFTTVVPGLIEKRCPQQLSLFPTAFDLPTIFSVNSYK